AVQIDGALGVVRAKVDRFANIAVGLAPAFTAFMNFPGGELKSPTSHTFRGIAEQLGALLRRKPGPIRPCPASGVDSLASVLRGRFVNVADDLPLVRWIK